MYDFVYDSHMLFNPLTIILNQNKLTELNYVNLKRNLDIVLITKGNKYILTQEHPDISAVNEPNADLEIYEK